MLKHLRDNPAQPAADAGRPVASLLQSARAHHHAGRLVKAEAQYREILQRSPGHPDALHLLGMIAFQAGRYDDAARWIERSLERDPAQAVRHFDLGNTYERMQRSDEAMASYRRAIALDPGYADAHFNLGTLFEKGGHADAAAEGYRRALAANPADAEAHGNLANLLHRQGRLAEATGLLQAAVHLAPRHPVYRYNLANVLKDQRHFDAAVETYREVLTLDPRFRPALENLAAVLHFQGNANGVAECCQQLVVLDPGSAAAHCGLGDALYELGRFDVALPSFMRALELDGDQPRYKANFARCVRNVEFTGFDPAVSELLVRAVSEPWARPSDLMKVCCELVCVTPGVREWVERALVDWPKRPFTPDWFGTDGLAALGSASLLRAALRNAPVCVLALERLLTLLRATLLSAAMSPASAMAAVTGNDGQVLSLAGALAEQCFINEYVFFATDDEHAAVHTLREQLGAALAAGTEIPVASLLAVAAYEPLAGLEGAARLLERPWPDPVAAMLRRQVIEPLEEAAALAALPRLTPIAAGVSARVRQQYEENPYPRWIHASPAFEDAVPLELQARRLFPFTAGNANPHAGPVDVLVAGCGTGQEPIELAQKIAGARILAIDMSLASLAYASRKAREMGLANIEYAQADITQLATLDRRFDFIESFGVLHHLADPLAGWRMLLSLLRPGGRMALGLYSEQARAGVVAARQFIAARGYAATPADIRRARQDMLGDADPGLSATLAGFRDFFATSECRDLLFHVQEHRFTLPQIEQAIAELGVRFLGFMVPPSIRRLYSRRFPADREQKDLGHWAEFEAEFPNTVLGMYGFWVEKPGIQPAG